MKCANCKVNGRFLQTLRLKCFNLGEVFYLSDGNTALHHACKSFLAEADADFVLFLGDEGNQKCVEMLAKKEDLDANIKNK